MHGKMCCCDHINRVYIREYTKSNRIKPERPTTPKQRIENIFDMRTTHIRRKWIPASQCPTYGLLQLHTHTHNSLYIYMENDVCVCACSHQIFDITFFFVDAFFLVAVAVIILFKLRSEGKSV